MAVTTNDSFVTKGILAYYDGKNKAWVKAEVSGAIAGLGNVFTVKSRVDSVDKLPTADVKIGDVYTVGAVDAAEFEEYYWNGSRWEYMGVTGVSLDGYVTEVALFKGEDGTGTTAIPAEGTLLRNLYNFAKTANDAVTELQGVVDSIDSDLTAVTTRVDTAEGDIAEINSNIESINSAIDGVKDDMVTMNGSIGDNAQAISDVEGRVETVETDVADAKNDISSVEGRVTDVETDLNTAEGNITELQGKVSSNETDIATIKAALDDEGGIDDRIKAVEDAVAEVTTTDDIDALFNS